MNEAEALLEDPNAMRFSSVDDLYSRSSKKATYSVLKGYPLLCILMVEVMRNDFFRKTTDTEKEQRVCARSACREAWCFDTAYGYKDVLKRHDKAVIDSYELVETDTELYLTEQVNNVLFEKH